ncbi:hypothetical protein HYY75_10610, partial [bacterium]|nr:hypothetical protein [bacterium]
SVELLGASAPDNPRTKVKSSRESRSSRSKEKADKKKQLPTSSSQKDSSKEKQTEEDLFLKEPEENQAYLPDIYRCPECGYEQDEEGTCPDHDNPLVLVLSKGKNPLEPPEVDGNEDLLVDFPITGLTFRKPSQVQGATQSIPLPRPR